MDRITDVNIGQLYQFEHLKKVQSSVKPTDKCAVCGCTAAEIYDHRSFCSGFQGILMKVDDGSKSGLKLCSACMCTYIQDMAFDILTLAKSDTQSFTYKQLRRQQLKKVKEKIRDDVRYRRAMTFFCKEFETRFYKAAEEQYKQGLVVSREIVEDLIADLNDNYGFKDEQHINYIATYTLYTDIHREILETFNIDSINEARAHASKVQTAYPSYHVIPVAVVIEVHDVPDDGYEDGVIKHERRISESCLGKSGMLTILADGKNKVELVETPIKIEKGGKFTIN